MSKRDIVLATIFVIGLIFSIVGMAEAKWAGNIDLLYNRFIAVIFFYGATIVTMKKN